MGGWRGWQRCQPRSAAGSHCSWWSGAHSWQHPWRWPRRCGATACTARSRRRRLRAGPAVASQAGCGRRPWRAAAQQSSSSAVSSPHAAARKRRPGSGRAGPRTQGPPRAAPDRWLRSTPDCERPGASLPVLITAYVCRMPGAQRPWTASPVGRDFSASMLVPILPHAAAARFA